MLDTQMPNRDFNPLVPVEVITTDLDTGKVDRRVIDHDDFEDRKWLGKHCFWAMRNGKSVETRPYEA